MHKFAGNNSVVHICVLLPSPELKKKKKAKNLHSPKPVWDHKGREMRINPVGRKLLAAGGRLDGTARINAENPESEKIVREREQKSGR